MRNFFISIMEEKRYLCPYCDGNYGAKQTLTQHLKFKCKNKPPVKVSIVPKISNHSPSEEVPPNIGEQLAAIKSSVDKLQQQQQQQPQSQVINSNNTITNNITNNNITIYFNKDLKYFTELVNIMGKQNAISYLLYTLPETKNLFDVMSKIFVREGVNLPFALNDDGEFIISRGENQTEIDTTGALIDLENKNKIKDAVLTAFVDTNKDHHAALQSVRLAQIRDPCDHYRNYTTAESLIINSTYESHLEPSRLYHILDMITDIKLKQKDYDILRRMIRNNGPKKTH